MEFDDVPCESNIKGDYFPRTQTENIVTTVSTERFQPNGFNRNIVHMYLEFKQCWYRLYHIVVLRESK